MGQEARQLPLKSDLWWDILNKKQTVVVLMNYLVEQGLDKTFVTKLVKRAICPDMFHNIQAYKWDKATMTITTHQDNENEKQKMIELAAW